MLIHEALLNSQKKLHSAGITAAKHESRLVCAYVYGVQPSQLPLYLRQSIDEAHLANLLERRIAGEPLQYILGEAGFMSLVFYVGPEVLIPRPDTEVLVEKAIKLLEQNKTPAIADIGLGSGAIAVSLAHYLPQATLYGVDISLGALQWAKKNANLHQVGERCHFYEGDLLAPLSALNLRFDLIISNPPYISKTEMGLLPQDVRQEPTIALYGGVDGLDFYRRLARGAKQLLKAGGWLLLEHGAGQQYQVELLLKQEGWQVVQALSDYGDRDRGILAH
ncbi:MAG: peptide chain release factor N(5)-glutamine methyltransferase [Clostridiales bacterium]|nr:peptide chain release factor N(5)-glutamine methyltransferase [Clostridiales bacterium]